MAESPERQAADNSRQQFLAFLYGAAVSVLVGHILRNQQVGSRDNFEVFILEIALLICSIFYISCDWLARKLSRERLSLNSIAVSVLWLVEVIWLVVIILAFGRFPFEYVDGQLFSKTTLVLFCLAAGLNWVWSMTGINPDPLTWKELAKKSLLGSVRDIPEIKKSWESFFDAWMHSKHLGIKAHEKKLSESTTISVLGHAKVIVYRMNMFAYRAVHQALNQFVAQHLMFFNAAIAAILGGFIFLSPTVGYDGNAPSEYMSMLAAESTLIALVFCMAIVLYSIGGNDSAETGTTIFKRVLVAFGNVLLFVGVILLYSNLSIDVFIPVMLTQQVAVSLLLITIRSN